MARAPMVGPPRPQSFALQVGAWTKKASTNADIVTRRIVIEMLSRVVMRTPVDTGRARANWQTTIGSPASGTLDAADKTGGQAIARGTAVAAQFPMGATVWLSNGLPYAERLEYGYSRQAPAGMVRVTVAEFQGLAAALAGQVNR